MRIQGNDNEQFKTCDVSQRRIVTLPKLLTVCRTPKYSIGWEGVHESIVVWIGEHLKDRRFQLVVNGSYFSTKCAPTGVPHSVLSQVLFNLYARNIPSVLRPFGVACKMCADDFKIYSNARGATRKLVLAGVKIAVRANLGKQVRSIESCLLPTTIVKSIKEFSPMPALISLS